MSPRRRTHDRRTVAVSILTAGAIACSGSAAVAASASAAPATPRDAVPAAPADGVTNLLALLTQLGSLVNPVLELTDGGANALQDVISALTGDQLASVLALLTGRQLEATAGALEAQGLPIPSQLASLLAQPPVAAAAPATEPVVAPLRARIFDTSVARDRRSVRLDLTCPAVSASACKVVVGTTVAGRRAAADRKVTVQRGRSKVVRPRLSTAVGKRLAARGGAVKLTVRTTGSTRGPVTSTVRVPALRGS